VQNGAPERAPRPMTRSATKRRLNDRARPSRQRRRNWVRPVPREPSHLRLDLHGLAGHAREWDRMARAFDDLHVLAVDLRGHGSSDWADSYAVDAYVHDVEGVVERVVSGPVMVVRHSLGASASTRGSTWTPVGSASPSATTTTSRCWRSPAGDVGHHRPANRPSRSVSHWALGVASSGSPLAILVMASPCSRWGAVCRGRS
jgi:pimeloyl-ACP methyl ester carboxylesterase